MRERRKVIKDDGGDGDGEGMDSDGSDGGEGGYGEGRVGNVYLEEEDREGRGKICKKSFAYIFSNLSALWSTGA